MIGGNPLTKMRLLIRNGIFVIGFFLRWQQVGRRCFWIHLLGGIVASSFSLPVCARGLLKPSTSSKSTSSGLFTDNAAHFDHLLCRQKKQYAFLFLLLIIGISMLFAPLSSAFTFTLSYFYYCLIGVVKPIQSELDQVRTCPKYFFKYLFHYPSNQEAVELRFFSC
ncbi:Secretion monitor [Pantoea sp. Nvir]|nr:Secretion monitor [Pantoea sp. Nvir]